MEAGLKAHKSPLRLDDSVHVAHVKQVSHGSVSFEIELSVEEERSHEV